MDDPGELHASASPAVLEAPPHSRGRRGRPAEAPREQSAAHRRGRARFAGRVLPRVGRSRHPRHRRLRCRRSHQSAATDPAHDRSHRRVEGLVREAHARGAEPGREDRRLRGAPLGREHRPDHRRLRPRDRWGRQLPHALSLERRVGETSRTGRTRLDLPIRGTGHRLQAVRGPVLPLPVPRTATAGARAVMRRGGRPRRAAGRHRNHPGDRGDQAAPRDRRAARRALPPV